MFAARRAVRLTMSAWAFAAASLSAGDALAWYFPEHLAIERDGLVELPSGVRDVLTHALFIARSEGLALCERADASLEDVTQKKPLRTKMVNVEVRVDCVPYAALAALGGDHSSSAAELRTVLSSGKGIEITSAVAYEWDRFKEALGREAPRSLERMSFVHELDVAFYFIDPGYELRAQATQAHFVDAGRPIDEAVREAAGGKLDNSLGQFLAHHVRSLELASGGNVTEAILEHAFAMHFLQDAFAAGHLVMTSETWKRGNAHARQRHDFYNARGLAVGRALAAEPCTLLVGAASDPFGLTPCWTTTGDGYLGLSSDTSDRMHVARAVAKAELQFALAIDPQRVVSAVEELSEREQVGLGQLLDPTPWWTVKASQRQYPRDPSSRALRLLRAAAVAVERMRSTNVVIPPIVVGTPSPADLLDSRVLANALDPCLPTSQTDTVLGNDEDQALCGAAHALGLGTVGVSLLRPLLVDWPTSRVDPNTLKGESARDLGWAVQMLAAADASVLLPPHGTIDFFAPAIGVSAGLSYRWGTYLPGRVNRAVAELNVGLSEALQYDSDGRAGANPHVTLLDQELRWPIAWELLTSYLLPLDLRKGHEAGGVLFFNGVRAHELVTNPKPVLWGIDLEVMAIALSRGGGAYPLYTDSPELRLHLGLANPQAAQPSFRAEWGPTIGIELTGGYATFL